MTNFGNILRYVIGKSSPLRNYYKHEDAAKSRLLFVPARNYPPFSWHDPRALLYFCRSELWSAEGIRRALQDPSLPFQPTPPCTYVTFSMINDKKKILVLQTVKRIYLCKFVLSILFGNLSSLRSASNFDASLSKLLLAISINRLAFLKFWRLMLFMYRTYARQWFFVFFTFSMPLITSLSVTIPKLARLLQF